MNTKPKGKPWTPDDRAELIKLWKCAEELGDDRAEMLRTLASRFGRSETAIKAQAIKLGLMADDGTMAMLRSRFNNGGSRSPHHTAAVVDSAIDAGEIEHETPEAKAVAPAITTGASGLRIQHHLDQVAADWNALALEHNTYKRQIEAALSVAEYSPEELSTTDVSDPLFLHMVAYNQGIQAVKAVLTAS